MSQAKIKCEKGMLIGTASGAAVAMMLSLVFCAAAAVALGNNAINGKNLGYSVICALLVCAYVGAFITVKLVNGKRLITCVLYAVFYECGLMMLSAIRFGMSAASIAVTFPLVFGGTAAAMISANKERKKIKRMKR